MKTASSTYKSLRNRSTSWYEWRVRQGEKVYGMDTLKSITVSPILSSDAGIGIGSANATECRLTLLEASANWERMAQFSIDFRICGESGDLQSEWITFGVYYTDERSEDPQGNLSIIAYDAMLKMEQPWTDKIPDESLPAAWPITARAWANMVQGAGVLTFENISVLDDTVAFIGLDTTSTVRDVLKSIAAVHASNWMVTAGETFKLVQFENVTSSQTSRYIDLGLAMQNFQNSPALDPVTGVQLETDLGTIVESGTDTGYVLKAECEFASTTGVAPLCLSKVENYIYQPFSATTAYLDPIMEIGDHVMIDSVVYQIMSIEWTMGKTPAADVSAPYDQEIDHEYKGVSEDAKRYRKTVQMVDEAMNGFLPRDEFATAIEQNEQAINLVASRTFVTQTAHNTDIQNLQNQIDGNIQTWSGNVVPTLNNSPAVDWSTPTQRAEHVGDLYFVNTDAGIPEAGQYYRFENNDGIYSWQVLSDSALSEALNKAAAALAAAEDAQDTADASMATASLKGRIWVQQPTPPYNVGDLWFNSVESVIKVCMTARESGNYVATDWEKRDMYTDDSAFEAFRAAYNATISAIQNQLDQKAETYYQDTDPSGEWDGIHPAGVAIVGIDVAGIPADFGQAHIGDLWYRTTDGTTWYFNGAEWEQQNVPDEVFDKIDGKAQIFISQPYTPYNQGDLWFNSATSDIMTCITARTSGDFVQSDWQKRNKYTDDTELNNFKETYQTDLTVQNNKISAKVSKTSPAGQTSFSWELNDTSHKWYANGTQVMAVNSSGLAVKGQITATSGYIGSESSGFNIGSTAIYNGMTSLSDTTHNGIYLGTDGIALGQGKFKVTKNGELTARSGYIGNGSSGFTIGDTYIRNGMTSLTDTANNGIYLGTNGIALGKGAFKVTNAGVITATSGTIGGFTLSGSAIYTKNQSSYSGTGNGIYIGADGLRIGSKFRVDNAGNLYADTGHFEGTVYAKNIIYEGQEAGAGYLTGSAITAGSIYGGGSTGQIAANTLGDYNVATYTSGGATYGAFTTGAFSSGVCGSLGYADTFGYAIKENSTYPAYFGARKIQAINAFYSGGYNVYGENGNVAFDLAGHYHAITVDSNGKVQLGVPQKDKPDPFDIADTQKYKTDVLASRAVLYCNATNYTDVSSGYDCDLTGSSYHYTPSGGNVSYGRIELRNSYGNNLKTLRVKFPATASHSVAVSVSGAMSSSATNHGVITATGSCGGSSASGTYDIYMGVIENSSSKVEMEVYHGSGSNKVTLAKRSVTPQGGSSTIASIVSASTDSDYSDYYQSGGRWKLYVHAKDSSGNTIFTDTIDIQRAVDWGAAQGGATGHVEVTSTSGNSAFVKLYNSSWSAIPINGSSVGRWIDAGTSYPFG